MKFKNTVNAVLFLLSFVGGVLPVWAGSEVIARLESHSGPEDWAVVDTLVEKGQVRLNIQGPWSRGSLIYDEKTKLIILVDDIHQTVVPISQGDQTAFKMMSYVLAGRMKDQVERSNRSVKLAYHLVEKNAQALFNGSPTLTEKNVRQEGFRCDLYESQTDGVKNRQVWMTPLESTVITSVDYQTLWSLTRQLIDLLGYELNQLGVDTTAFLQGYSNFQVPVQTVLYANGKISSQFKIIKIIQRRLDAAVFEPPTGYQNLSLLDIVQQSVK